MATFTTPYKDLLPPLSTDEMDALYASIKLEGVRDPVVVDELSQVLDGHHRLMVAPDAPIRVVSGLSEAEKRAFVYRANFARRNLTPDQKRERAQRMKEVAKKLRDENVTQNTQERIAALLGVTQRTVSNWLSVSVSKSSKANIPKSHMKIDPKEKPVIQERLEAGEKQEQVAADYGVSRSRIAQISTAERKAKEKRQQIEEAIQNLGECGMQQGDFRDLGKAVPDSSVDFIFTDPPYDKEAIPLYGDLAALAARVLRPGGWCLAYSGQTWLPDVLRLMAIHLTYGWIFAIRHTGGDMRYRKFKIQNAWKPVVGFYKPPLGDAWWEWFSDMVSGGKEKGDHEWQQATGEARHYIKALCPRNGVVLDPMAGSGTTCVAAILEQRQWIAFEKEAKTFQGAVVRIHKALGDSS